MRRHWAAAPIAGAASRAAVSIAWVRWRRRQRPWTRTPASCHGSGCALLPDWRRPSCACQTCLRGDGGGGGELEITGTSALPGRTVRSLECVAGQSFVRSDVSMRAVESEQQRARRACAQASKVARQQSRERERDKARRSAWALQRASRLGRGKDVFLRLLAGCGREDRHLGPASRLD